MGFCLNTPYYQIPGSQPEPAFGAIMQMLLKSRVRLKLEAHEKKYDEDVNTYLAGLLVSYIDPSYLKAISEVLSHYDIDVFQAVSRAEDRYQAYWIYKVNADDLLVSVGIFRKIWQQAKADVIRMQQYYTSASEYQRRIYGKLTAVGEIQTKLAEGPDRYLAILADASNEYLHLVEQAQSDWPTNVGEWMRRYEQDLVVRSTQDELLDAYSAWLKGARDPETCQRLLDLVERLKVLDSTFEPETILSHLGMLQTPPKS